MLGVSSNVADVIRAATGRNIVTILLWPEHRNDGNYICIPDDAGYDQAPVSLGPLQIH